MENVPAVPRIEYTQRWEKVVDGLRARDLDGIVVWSRDGATMDSYADVYYLANYYGHWALVPPFRPYWVGRSHSALVLPVAREPTLIIDVADWRDDLVVVEDVRFSTNVAQTTADVLAEYGLSESRLGLVGANVMVLATYEEFVSAAAGAVFVRLDEFLEELRAIKSDYELELVREAAVVGNAVVHAIMDAALKPGTTEGEAVAAGYSIGIARGMAIYDAAVASGPNSNFFAYGQLPSWTGRRLESGDLFHVDAYGAINGYLFDFGRTCVVGGRPSRDQRELMEAGIEAVEAGIEHIAEGVEASTVFHVIEKVLVDAGVTSVDNVGEAEVKPAMAEGFPAYGHGFGLAWEWPWIHPGEERPLQRGMCLAVETMPGRPDLGASYFEQDVALTEAGVELLTTGPRTYW